MVMALPILQRKTEMNIKLKIFEHVLDHDNDFKTQVFAAVQAELDQAHKLQAAITNGRNKNKNSRA